jgi:hypothetical protein
MTNVSAFFSEFLATAVLLIVVFAFSDRSNAPPLSGLVPVALFLLVVGIGCALGMQTGYAINPARDLGPRLLTAMVGYGAPGMSFLSGLLVLLTKWQCSRFAITTGSGVLRWQLSSAHRLARSSTTPSSVQEENRA